MVSIFLLLLPLALYADDYSDVTSLESSGEMPEDFPLLATNEVRRKKRGLALHPNQWSTHLWPGAVVPYDIASHYDSSERAIILSAMNEFHQRSCIRFVPRRSSDRYYLMINKWYPTESCYSYIGRQTSSWLFGVQGGKVETRMRLAPRCLASNGKGIVMHELMHILGFYHEHQRDDRDQRVFGSANHYNFKLYPRQRSYYMGAYDVESIMHYNFRNLWRPRSDFSPSDIQHVNQLYRCHTIPTTTTTTTTTTSPSKNQMTSWEDRKLETNEIFRRRL